MAIECGPEPTGGDGKVKSVIVPTSGQTVLDQSSPAIMVFFDTPSVMFHGRLTLIVADNRLS
jgi:hypothetical protein